MKNEKYKENEDLIKFIQEKLEDKKFENYFDIDKLNYLTSLTELLRKDFFNFQKEKLISSLEI